MSAVRRLHAVVGVAITSYAALYALGRASGCTAEERRAALPGDELVPHPDVVTDHAATVPAPPDRIWPWLAQMGWHLGGYYTPRWVDRLLFPGNWPSLDRLDPALVRDLQVGDTIPDGPPGTAEHVVVEVAAPHLLVTRSTTHLPPGWQDKYGVAMVWTWCFRLTQDDRGHTRVHLRVRGHMEPAWFRAFYLATIVPADAVMAPAMLRGLRRRVRADLPPELSGRAPLDPDLARGSEFAGS